MHIFICIHVSKLSIMLKDMDMAVVCALHILEPKREKYVGERGKMNTLSNSYKHPCLVAMFFIPFLTHSTFSIRNFVYLHASSELFDYFLLFF